MTCKIFISYRRQDDWCCAQLIFRRLESEFPAGGIFMDVESRMRGGDDYVAFLHEHVTECDVLLAIIGERWLDARDEDGSRRLDKEDDFVRMEIVSALDLGKRVIPVLMNDARAPRSRDLPTSLKPLAHRNTVAIRPISFQQDSQGLIGLLKDELKMAEQAAESAAAEAERKLQQEQEKERKAQLDKVGDDTPYRAERGGAPPQPEAGPTREEIRRHTELLNWHLIRDSNRAGDFLDHLARYPGGTTERFARSKLEELAWDRVSRSTSPEELYEFLAEFPKGEHAAAAHACIRKLRHIRLTRRGLVGATAAVGGTGVLYLATRPPPDFLLHTFTGHTSFVLSVAFSQDGNRMLSGSADRTMKVLDVRSGTAAATLSGHAQSVLSVALSPNGNRALSGSSDNTVKLWDVDKAIKAWEASGSGDAAQALWEAGLVRTFTGHRAPVLSVAFSPNGRRALSGSWDKTLKLWDVEHGTQVHTFRGHDAPVLSVAFSPGGDRVLSGSADKTLKLWDTASGKEVYTFKGHSDWVRSVAFSPKGGRALSGSHDGMLKLWDVDRKVEVRNFTGHGASVTSVAFSPDGARVLSGSDDRTLGLWDVTLFEKSGSAREVRSFAGHTDAVTSVAFSPNGLLALSGSYDNTMKLWDISPPAWDLLQWWDRDWLVAR